MASTPGTMEGKPRYTYADYLRLPPDLAVEVLSPSNAGLDRTRKQKLYARFGVPRVWIVDVEERTLECLTLDRGAYRIDGSWTGDEIAVPPGFDGLEIPVSTLWPAQPAT
jgi:Uma2 family endonuclease